MVAANERASMSAGAAHSHFRVCAGRPDAGLEDCRDDDGELAVVDGHRERGERVSLSETSEADPVGSARATLSLPQCTHAIAFVVAGACVAGSVTAASVTEGISSRKAYAKVGSTARASASKPSAPMAFSDASSLTSAVAVHEPSGLRRGRTACASAAAPSSPARLPPTPSARRDSFATQKGKGSDFASVLSAEPPPPPPPPPPPL